MAAHADRNLLFGILALQMDFVSRDALIAAMHAWVLDKQKPLGEGLLSQGALNGDTLALLDALVNRHLGLHGGDACKSLAVLSTVGDVRRDLEQLSDADVQASLALVSSDRHDETPLTRGGDPNATRPHSPEVATSAGMRFCILRPHARGGRGASRWPWTRG